MRRPQASVNRRDVGRRDAGLVRLNRLTRWIAAGAVALVGVFTALLAHALPGRSAGASSPPQTSGNPAPTTTTSPAATGNTGNTGTPAVAPALSLQPPAQAPSPAPTRRARVVSGGS